MAGLLSDPSYVRQRSPLPKPEGTAWVTIGAKPEGTAWVTIGAAPSPDGGGREVWLLVGAAPSLNKGAGGKSGVGRLPP